jgi:WD40 repeat protein
MVTVGEDKILSLFDLNNNKFVKCISLEKTPTVAKFTPNGELLIVGFANGDILVYDSQIIKNIPTPNKNKIGI